MKPDQESTRSTAPVMILANDAEITVSFPDNTIVLSLDQAKDLAGWLAKATGTDESRTNNVPGQKKDPSTHEQPSPGPESQAEQRSGHQHTARTASNYSTPSPAQIATKPAWDLE